MTTQGHIYNPIEAIRTNASGINHYASILKMFESPYQFVGLSSPGPGGRCIQMLTQPPGTTAGLDLFNFPDQKLQKVARHHVSHARPARPLGLER